MSNTNDVALLDRISKIMSEFGSTKAAERNDSIGGKSTHETAIADPCEVPAKEKEQTAFNANYNKENVPNGTDSTPEATPGSETTQSEAQVGTATPTGEGSYPQPEDRPSDVPTSHPADASVGEKYSADLSVASIDDLLKMASELGNDLSAAIATGFLTEDQPQMQQRQAATGNANKAAAAGSADALMAAQAEDEQAAYVIEAAVKEACDCADMTAGYLTQLLAEFSKQAEGEMPMEGELPPEEGMPPEEGGGDEEALAALLAALQGAEGGGEMGGLGEEAGAGGEDAAAAELLEAMAGPGGAEGGLEGGEGAPLEGDMAGAPDELASMPDEEALMQLLAALEEEGGSEADLKTAGDVGSYLSKSASEFRKAGKYKYKGAKRGSTERRVRDYIKGYIHELYRRNK